MDLSTVTVADFKSLFRRDFPYLNVYDSGTTYNQGTVVYFTDMLFYCAAQDGITAANPPPDTIYWNKVTQDADNYIQDDDIEKAFAEAMICFNQGLFGTDDQIKLGYLYMTAHYLCNDIRAAIDGITGTARFPVSARSAGSVSESYSIPQAYTDDPLLAFYSNSTYGLKFLAMALPNLRGNVGAVAGTTLP